MRRSTASTSVSRAPTPAPRPPHSRAPHAPQAGGIRAGSSGFESYLEQLLQQLGFSAAEKQAFLREFWKVQAGVNRRLSLEDLQDISALLRQETAGNA